MDYRNIKYGFGKRRVNLIYLFYWLMLTYILAALVFWFIALDSQNEQITHFKELVLDKADPGYQSQLNKIKDEEKRKTFQYIGEGLTFFLLIIAGAVVVFRMLRKQLRLSRQQKDFMTAITHELKTPIAVLKLNLETIQKRQLDPALQSRLLTASLSETDRLNALCSNMLLLNEMDALGYASANEDLLVNDIISDCITDHKSRHPDRNFIVNTEADLHIDGDRMLLRLALNNLLDNAIKYSPKNTPVAVHAFRQQNNILVKVIDEGEGISIKDAHLIFEKFYRGAGMQAKGTGLGLYVTRQIINLSRGALNVEPNHPKGSIFTISFAT